MRAISWFTKKSHLILTHIIVRQVRNTIWYPTDILIFFRNYHRYAVNAGISQSGLGTHILSGLGCCGATSMLCCWIPWIKSPSHAIQTTVFCASDPALAEQSGLYYSNCNVHLTSELGSNMDDAYKLWEMSERMVRLSS